MFSFLRKNKDKKKQTTDENTQEISSELQSEQTVESAQIDANNADVEKPYSEANPELDQNTAPETLEQLAENKGESLEPAVKTEEQNLSETKSTAVAEEKAEVISESVHEAVNEAVEETQVEQAQTETPAEPEKKVSFFTRLKQGLSKTRQSFTDSLASLVLGRKEIDDDLLDDLEMILLTADVGIEATDKIISNLTQQVSRKELKDPEALITALKTQLQEIIDPMSQPLDIDSHLAQNGGPFVILMVGINGVGKTTTIGKLAKKFQLEGKSVMLAAGDTFRAAAVEQLQTWGERNNVPVVAQKTGADSAAVIFDAIQSAKAKNIDVLIADTAGRLHTQSNLMEELKKVKRVMAKVDEKAPHEVMLVIDAGTGQNALNQAKQFGEAVDVSGVTLTKLDGTAKGGIVYALAEQQQIPIRFIGVGESIDDLRSFDSKDFTEALFDQSKNT